MELQRDTSERVGEEREGEGEGGQVGVMNRGEKRGKQERRVREKGRRVERRGRGKRLRTFFFFFSSLEKRIIAETTKVRHFLGIVWIVKGEME